MKKDELIIIGNENNLINVMSINLDSNYKIQLSNKFTLNKDDRIMIHGCLIKDDDIFILDSYNSVLYKHNLSHNTIEECYTGRDPRHLCSYMDSIYITNFESDSVSIVDMSGCYLTGTFTVGMKPHDILEFRDKLYIACFEENCILEYNIKTNEKKYMFVDGKPMHMRREKNILYVLSYIINGETKSVINQIDLNTFNAENIFFIKEITDNFTIDNILNWLLILSIEKEKLYIFDINNKRIIKQIHLNVYPDDVSADNNNIYIANSDKKIIVVIDKLTFEQKKIIHLDFSPSYIKVI